jgi:hypothetical protein
MVNASSGSASQDKMLEWLDNGTLYQNLAEKYKGKMAQ